MQENKQQIKFLGLAYAELKVNFVEGFAVLCLRRFLLSRGASLFLVSMASPFLCLKVRCRFKSLNL